MIDARYIKGEKRHILLCDICGEEEGKDFGDFYAAVDHAKRNGWKRGKVAGEWGNYCPGCIIENNL